MTEKIVEQIPQKRIRDYGVKTGSMKTGPGNKITDVPGVKVGQVTLHRGDVHTGVTVIVPGEASIFEQKFVAAAYVHNGYGKTCGTIQIEELGTLETPIALTNTLNVGLVADALVQYTIDSCVNSSVPVTSVNPVVGECNDSQINRIAERAVRSEHVLEALKNASEAFDEGAVGAGAGTTCYGLKGGIGSASRRIKIGKKEYTIGVLVQSNFGSTKDFVLCGKPVGQSIRSELSSRKNTTYSEQDQGSIMSVIATDLPVSDRQLKRIIRRAGVGIARTGAYTGHGSGEVMLGFSTANRLSAEQSELITEEHIREDLINRAFEAVAEAEQEAIYNSMITAQAAISLNGRKFETLAAFSGLF